MHKVFLIIALVTCSIFGFMFYQYHEQKKEVGQFEFYQTVLSEKSFEIYEQAKDWSKPISIDTKDHRLDPDFQVMADFMLNMLVQNAELRNAYLRELKDVHWDKFLDIHRLEKDKQRGYIETQTMFEQVEMMMDLYQQNLDEHKKEMQDQIKSLPIKARFRRYLTEALIKKNSIDEDQALFELEKLRFDKAKQLFSILKQDKWIKKNNTFMFYDQTTVSQFNRLYREIAALDKRMKQITKYNKQELEKAL